MRWALALARSSTAAWLFSMEEESEPRGELSENVAPFLLLLVPLEESSSLLLLLLEVRLDCLLG